MSRRRRQWRRRKFSGKKQSNLKNFIYHSESFWAVYFKSWICELFQRTFIKVKSLIFTYSTFFLELVLYWLILNIDSSQMWQFLSLFRSIKCRIFLSNNKIDRIYHNDDLLQSAYQHCECNTTSRAHIHTLALIIVQLHCRMCSSR